MNEQFFHSSLGIYMSHTLRPRFWFPPLDIIAHHEWSLEADPSNGSLRLPGTSVPHGSEIDFVFDNVDGHNVSHASGLESPSAFRRVY